MEFRFNVIPFFNEKIIRVDQNLMPVGFKGDRRQMQDASTKMIEIVNSLGEASARAQGLNKAVTSAQKLRNSDHCVYIMSDDVSPNGSVVGLLKVGTKNLYIFDPNGETKQVAAPCVLDFYVHESRQRSGLGKKMFETMLAEQKCHPSQMAIDRPSEKLLGFLSKHYGLKNIIPQMNNFVVYEGFFNNGAAILDPANERKVNITNSPNTALFGPHVAAGQRQGRSNGQSLNGNSGLSQMPGFQTSPMGRFGAPRPLCSMSEHETRSQGNFNERPQDASIVDEDAKNVPSEQSQPNQYPPKHSYPYSNAPFYNHNMYYPQYAPGYYHPQYHMANAASWNPINYMPAAQYQHSSNNHNPVSENIEAMPQQYAEHNQSDKLIGPKYQDNYNIEPSRTNPSDLCQQMQQPFNTNPMQWRGQGLVCPMIQAVPVCKSCSNTMVPAWKCPNDHTQVHRMSTHSPGQGHLQSLPTCDTQMKPTHELDPNIMVQNSMGQCAMVNNPLVPSHMVQSTILQNPLIQSPIMQNTFQNSIDPNTIVPNKMSAQSVLQIPQNQMISKTMAQNPMVQSVHSTIAQPVWNQQVNDCLNSVQYAPTETEPPSTNSFSANMDENNGVTPNIVKSAHLQTQSPKPQSHSPPTVAQVQPENIFHPNIQPTPSHQAGPRDAIPENVSMCNSFDQIQYKNEYQKRGEDSLNNSRRSNGLDPGYSNLMRNRQRNIPLEPGLSGHLRTHKIDQMIIHNKPTQKSSEPNSAPFQKLGNDFKL